MIWLILWLSWGCSTFWLSDSNIMHSVFDLARILVCNLKRKTIVVKSLPSHYISQFFFCILLPCCFYVVQFGVTKIYLDNCSTRFNSMWIELSTSWFWYWYYKCLSTCLRSCNGYQIIVWSCSDNYEITLSVFCGLISFHL